MSDEALKARELQPLREHLEELGEAALPAVREYLERLGMEAKEKPKPIVWELPARFTQGAPIPMPNVRRPIGRVLRLVGFDRNVPVQPSTTGEPPPEYFMSIDYGMPYNVPIIVVSSAPAAPADEPHPSEVSPELMERAPADGEREP